jgi:Trypsin
MSYLAKVLSRYSFTLSGLLAFSPLAAASGACVQIPVDNSTYNTSKLGKFSQQQIDALKLLVQFKESNPKAVALAQLPSGKLAELNLKALEFYKELPIELDVNWGGGEKKKILIPKSGWNVQTSPLEPSPPGNVIIPGNGGQYKYDKFKNCYVTAQTSSGTFQSNGFAEVGLLRYKREDKLNELCTFFLIEKGLAITALHCVADQGIGSNQGQLIRNADLDLSLCLLEVDAKGEPDAQVPCKMMSAVRVLSIDAPPDWTWPADSKLPNKDLALLSLQLDPGLSQKLIKAASLGTISNNQKPPFLTTSAGYGTSYGKIDKISVSLRTNGRINNPASFLWPKDKDSNACAGDSGAPLYLGSNKGATDSKGIPKDQYLVIGVMSFNSDKAQLASNCLEREAGFVLVQAHQKWLCEAAKGKNVGPLCPQ